MERDDELARRWEQILDDVNVLLIHGPARGLLDRTAPGAHVGSISLCDWLMELATLRLLICGHIHESHGTATLPRAGSVVDVVNASIVDFPGYQPVNPPLELTL